MKAIQIEAFGKPADVINAVVIPDVGAPAVGEVIRDFDRVAKTSTTARELYDKMLELLSGSGQPELAGIEKEAAFYAFNDSGYGSRRR